MKLSKARAALDEALSTSVPLMAPAIFEMVVYSADLSSLFGGSLRALTAMTMRWELSPKFGDGLRDQAAAVWDCEAAGLSATSIPSVNLTP